MAINGKLVARNAVLNLLGLTIPLVAAVIFIPPVITRLGYERFGVFALTLAILSYFTVFDFGLGRAVTKHAAAAIGRNDMAAMSRYTWTAMAAQFVLGCTLTALLLVLLPTILVELLNVPAHLLDESKLAFSILAIIVPAILVASSISGVLEAAQRFDLVNAVRIPSNILLYALPLIGVTAGLNLGGILTLILVSRLASLCVLGIMAYRTFPVLREINFDRRVLPHLFIYGGWIMAGNALGPAVLYVDRFVIATIVGLSAVTAYIAPLEVVARLQIISGGLILALFPIFGSMPHGNSRDFHHLFLRSAKYITLLAGPVIVLLFVFANPLLSFWLGSSLGSEATDVFRVFLLGSLLGLPAPLANSVLQAIGRPDVLPKIYLAYSVPYFLLLLIAAHEVGILGVAACASLRSAIDTILLVSTVSRLTHLPSRQIARSLAKTTLVLMLFACVLGASMLLNSPISQGLVTLLSLSALVFVAWRYLLDHNERSVFVSLLRK